MAAIEDFLADAKRRMDKSIEATHHEFNSIRTGRASPALLDRINDRLLRDADAAQEPRVHLGAEARLLVVQPFDPGAIKNIERAIQESDLGLTPSNDGKLIRLPIPTLTEERRKDLVKVVRRVAEEEGRDPQREARHHAAPEGARRERRGGRRRGARAEQQVQKITDDHTKSIDDLLKVKEAEIMEV